jgi:peptide/nickel transport system permease protein
VTAAGVLDAPPRGRRGALVRRALATPSAKIGVVLLVGLVGVAVIGPWVAPESPTKLLEIPFSQPGHGRLLGTDYLGRDVFSRFLWGGRVLLVLAILSTLLAYVVGITIGLLAAFRRGPLDAVLMGGLDLALAFPPLIFVLVLLSAIGPKLWLVVLGVAAIFAPRVARIVRGAALDVVLHEFVEAAVARGERTAAILFREILPNLWPPILADFGVRLTGSVIVIASLSFLGFGQQPPSADWGLLIAENRAGILIQPWAVVAPVFAIALLTVGINLVADGIVRALGRSEIVEATRAR